MSQLADQTRLAAVRAFGLHGLADPARAPFERLVRIVGQALGVPVSAVTLLDDERLRVITAHGMDVVECEVSESVCSRVIESDAPLLITDTRLDPMYGPDSLPIQQGVIAYAGVPLRDAAGAVLGTLCAVEAKPRQWSDAELALLEDLSRVGTAELAARDTAAFAEQMGRRIGAVVASSLDAIVTMDGTGLITEFNPAAERMFGYTRGAAVGRRLSTLLVPPDDRAAHESARERAMATGSSSMLDRRLERTAMRADGSEFPVEITVTRTDTDDETGFTGFIRDLSSQRRAERALSDVEARLALTVESAPMVLFAFDLDGRLTVCEGSALKAWGVDPAPVVGESAFDHYADNPPVLDALHRALRGEAVDLTHRVGDLVLESRYRPILDGDRITGVAGLALDVSDRLRNEARIAELAYVDRLTRLPNRTWLEEAVGRALTVRSPVAGRTAALLFVDLDEFQAVNDSLGHAAGDEVLREVAARLLSTVGPGAQLARQGADEFLIFIEGLGPDPQAVAERVALEVIAALEAPFGVSGLEFHVEASVGISLFPRDGDGFSELLRGAESALHRAKRAAGTRMAVHRRDDEGARHRLTLSARLRRALAQEELVLHYQPIVELEDGRPAGVEALLRWDDPDRGLIAPLDFIPIAEATGLIVPIGAWVAEAACRQAAAWRDLGLDMDVGFNVSPVQLGRGDFAGQVAQIIERTGAPPGGIVVEVTESVAMEGGPETDQVLERLADLGIAVAVDDFGAGHSSLTRLRRLEIGSLKIDRALLEGVPGDPAAAAVVSATLALAEALGIPTVAEGVETEAQRVFLRDRGCRWAQGFGLASPMAAEAATAFLLASLAPVAGGLTGG